LNERPGPGRVFRIRHAVLLPKAERGLHRPQFDLDDVVDIQLPLGAVDVDDVFDIAVPRSPWTVRNRPSAMRSGGGWSGTAAEPGVLMQ
jgi:hypothetical protein